VTTLTRSDELFIASQLQQRMKRFSAALARNERKPLHPEFVKKVQADLAECARISQLLTGVSAATVSGES
jgi:hypothetical protein